MPSTHTLETLKPTFMFMALSSASSTRSAADSNSSQPTPLLLWTLTYKNPQASSKDCKACSFKKQTQLDYDVNSPSC
jgi:hypothetical protein